MSKLSKLISKSRVSEVFSAANRMILEFDGGDWSEETNLTNIFNDLKPANNTLEEAINKEKAISDLEEKDEIRDTKVRAIYYLIMGYLHNPEASLKSAAEEVDKVFERYGVEIVRNSYSNESGFINSLLNDLSAEDLQSSIGTLPGLSQAITELETAQTNFETARLAYEKEAAEDVNETSATSAKKEVVSIINERLVVYLRAMITIDEAKYGEFTNTIDKIIDDNNEEVKKRKKKTEPGMM